MRAAAVLILPSKMNNVLPVRHDPVPLAPIRWGEPDPVLARGVIQNLVETTPATVIPANPITAGKVRAWMTTHHIHHYVAFARRDA